MKRNDACINVDVDSEPLLALLAALPDRCRSINPFLRCTVGVEEDGSIPSRLLKKISDLAIVRESFNAGRRLCCVSACGFKMVWAHRESADPKREWIMGLILELLKQGVASGTTA